MSAPAGRLFCFGLGYSALALARVLIGAGWTVSGTCRSAEKAADLRARGFAAELFERGRPLPGAAMAGATHVLVSVPPDPIGDPALDSLGGDIAQLPGLAWLGYLSTTGVYGDRAGGWVDETSALRPSGERGRRRVAAETGWLESVAAARGPGPHLPARRDLRSRPQPVRGIARRHRPADRQARPGVLAHPCRGYGARARCLDGAGRGPAPSTTCATTSPRHRRRSCAHAAALLGLPAPPLMPIAEAQLSAMARSFYDDNKRVDNALIKRELGVGRCAIPITAPGSPRSSPWRPPARLTRLAACLNRRRPAVRPIDSNRASARGRRADDRLQRTDDGGVLRLAAGDQAACSAATR